MEIKQNFLVNNECYKAGRTIKVTKLMVHSTACPNVSAAGFAKAWNTPRPADRQVCVHAFVDDKLCHGIIEAGTAVVQVMII